MKTYTKRIAFLATGLSSLAFFAGPALAAPSAATVFPRAGELLSTTLAAHAQPSQSSPVVTVFTQFRKDYAPTILLAVAQRRAAGGVVWLRVAIPMRPNGRYGWVRAASVQSQAVTKRIVVDVSSRKLSLYDHGKLRFRTRAAVGTAQNPTPLGSFYVQARFRPTNSFLGSFAFETSAYAPSLSEWPGGGLIGIHGTSEPQLLGRAVSHGCIRVSNAAARTLERFVPAGTPITIRR